MSSPPAPAAPDRPYRSATATALEALVHRGPLPALAERPTLAWQAATPERIASLIAVGAFVVWGSAVYLAWLILAYFGIQFVGMLARSIVQGARWDRRLDWLRGQLAALPFAVDGVELALARPGQLGDLELELAERHPLAEPAVRVAEPGARTTWSGDHVLRVIIAWYDDADDVARLHRLLCEVLAPHAGELGLRRVRLLPPARALPPARGPALEL